MIEEKFTKGPWHYDQDNKSIYNFQCNYICDAPLNNAADKYLIAMSPELYEFVDFAVNCLDMSQDRFEQGNTLLAKARGEK